MKKIIVLLTAFLLSVGASFAQVNVHFTPITFSNLGTENTQRVWADMSLCTDNSSSYVEIQTALNTSEFYVQLFHEQKFWEVPAYAHVEYRGQKLEGIEHMLLVGGTYSANTKHGFIALTPLLRVDGESKNWGHVQPMFSVVTGHDWNIFNLNSFTDFWYDKNYQKNGFNWYTEYWAYFNICKYLELGGVGVFSYSGPETFYVSIAPAIKIKF